MCLPQWQYPGHDRQVKATRFCLPLCIFTMSELVDVQKELLGQLQMELNRVCVCVDEIVVANLQIHMV